MSLKRFSVPIGMVALVLLLLLVGCTSAPSNPNGGASTGRIVIGITDAAANMESVSKIDVTIDQIQVHSASKGWVTVSSTSKTVDLLALKSQSMVVALTDVNLQPGTYQQLRLQISKVMVTDETGTTEAKLPSNELKLVGQLDVNSNSTSTVVLDVLADESLHVTGNGKYILAPVIQMETRSNATVEAGSNNSISVRGGTVKSNAKFGMDIQGNMGVGIGIPRDTALDIDAQGKIRIGLGPQGRGNGRVVIGITDAKKDLNNVTSILLTVTRVEVRDSNAGLWNTISSSVQTFDLIALSADSSIALMADVNVMAGTYDQIRLSVSDVNLTVDNQAKTAKLPSNVLRIDANLEVDQNETATAVLDFNADDSLHVTGNGKYILAPVILVETKSEVDVSVTQGQKVILVGGITTTKHAVGMNEDGEMGVDMRIGPQVILEIGVDGIISIP